VVDGLAGARKIGCARATDRAPDYNLDMVPKFRIKFVPELKKDGREDSPFIEVVFSIVIKFGLRADLGPYVLPWRQERLEAATMMFD
jgi:hypothetical protein